MESSQNGSHMTTIIQNFTLVSLISTVAPHPIELPLGAAVLSLPTHSSPYTLISLRTRLSTHLSLYALVSLHTRLLIMARKDGEERWQGRISICLKLFTCRGMQFVILDCHSKWRGSWAVGWTQSTLLSCVVVNLVISIDQSNLLDDERSSSVCHRFDDKSPPSVCYQVFRETGSMTKIWRILTFNMSSS